MTKSIAITAIAVALTASVALPSLAADEHNISVGVTTAGVPLGLQGVDAVALSTLNAVAEGDAAHTVVHDGIAYYFSSKDSAEKFEAAPDTYLPRFGAFCAYAVALGKKFDGDPRYADIVDGKLYLFVNAEIFAKYKKDSKRIVEKAEATWPSIQHTAVKDL